MVYKIPGILTSLQWSILYRTHSVLGEVRGGREARERTRHGETRTRHAR